MDMAKLTDLCPSGLDINSPPLLFCPVYLQRTTSTDKVFSTPPDKMKLAAVAVFLALASQALSAQRCQPPKYETTYFRTKIQVDQHIYYDFDQGLIFYVYSDDPKDDAWWMVDLNKKLTYRNTPSGCRYFQHGPEVDKSAYEMFQRCLPDDATLVRSGLVDFYLMQRDQNGLRWLIGVQDFPGTEFFYIHFSRFSAVGGQGVAVYNNEDETYGVAYKSSMGISDPTVFDKDLSACEAIPA